MGSNLKMVVVSLCKLPQIHSRCSRRLKKANVSPMASIQPAAMHDIVTHVGRTNSDAIGIDIGTLTNAQINDAIAIADTNMLRYALFDSRRPSTVGDDDEHKRVWDSFCSAVQSIRDRLRRESGRVPQAPRVPAPSRDDRRQAAALKGECDVAPAPAASIPNALRKLPEPEPVEAKAEVVTDSRPDAGRDSSPTFSGERREIDGWPLVKLSGDSVPRILDTELAKQLEYADPTDIRELIRAHESELLKFGDLSPHRERRPGLFRGKTQVMQEVTAYYLNRRQAVYLAIHSTTDKAKSMAVVVVDVFDAWTQGTLPAKPGTLDEDLARFLAQRTEARLAEQDAASKARDEELARKHAELEAQQELDRKAAEERDKAAEKHAEELVTPLASKIEDLEFELVRTKKAGAQLSIRPTMEMTLDHRKTVRRNIERQAILIAVDFAHAETDESEAEFIWAKERIYDLGAGKVGRRFSKSFEEDFDVWMEAIPQAAREARKERETMRMRGIPLTPSYLATVKSRVRCKKHVVRMLQAVK